jgi:hypothetical protein
MTTKWFDAEGVEINDKCLVRLDYVTIDIETGDELGRSSLVAMTAKDEEKGLRIITLAGVDVTEFFLMNENDRNESIFVLIENCTTPEHIYENTLN